MSDMEGLIIRLQAARRLSREGSTAEARAFFKQCVRELEDQIRGAPRTILASRVMEQAGR